MRELFPFTYSDLGWAELAWLFLAFGGLSLLARARGHRLLGAGLAVAALELCGFFHWFLDEPQGAWQRLILPFCVLPAIGAGIVLLGKLRPALQRASGGAGRLGGLFVAALAAASLLLQPFGLSPGGHAAEWVFLAFLGVFLSALAAPDGVLGRALAERRGRVRTWWFLAAAFLVFTGLGKPFGFHWPGAVAILFFLLLWRAVQLQSAELRRYVAHRLIGTPIVLLVLVTASFFMMRLAPGNPFVSEKTMDPSVQAQLMHEFHFDRPLFEQYLTYISGVVWKGDFSISLQQVGRRVTEIIAYDFKPSLILGSTALVLALAIGIGAGVISGVRQNSVFDYASMTGAMLGLALPTFVVGPLLVLVFAMKLDWFHVTGWDLPRDLVLPAITLALPFAARIARLTRAGMLEVVHQDYIRTARAKGLPERIVVARHTLKGALLPVVSFLGPAIAQMLTGSLVVEKIFGIPGLGKEFVQSALNRDYFLALGLVILFGTLLVLFNLVVNVFYAFLDPRIRHG